jgi:hypothetical protein
MKTLGEIIEAARSGERPDYDDMRLALCAVDMLMTFDRQAIWKLSAAESEGKKPFMVNSAVWQRDENFDRVKRAMSKTPLEYLGPNYNPDSDEVQERRSKSIALMDKIISAAGKRGAS